MVADAILRIARGQGLLETKVAPLDADTESWLTTGVDTAEMPEVEEDGVESAAEDGLG